MHGHLLQAPPYGSAAARLEEELSTPSTSRELWVEVGGRWRPTLAVTMLELALLELSVCPLAVVT